MTHSETVQQIYAAFGRGDIPAILDHLAEDVVWEYAISPNEVPWLQPRQGRGEVPAFFASLGGMEFHTFQPKTLLENGNLVVALIDVAFEVKATGLQIVEEDEVHLWHFNEAGQVSKFGHKLDTHRHWVAYRGEAVPSPR